MKSIIVLLIALGVASAARQDSLKVVSSLRALQPAYRDLTLFVVDAVAGSKRSVSDVIYKFQTQVVDTKEQYLRSTIKQEETLLGRINSQDPSVSDEGCLKKLRDKVQVDVLLSGIKFSSCILEIDEQLNKQISKVYGELDESSGSPKNISIYQAFRGANIFENPKDIDDNLQKKLTQLQNLPTNLIAELQGYVDEFKDQLTPIVGLYKGCLQVNEDLLVEAFNIIKKQLTYSCSGV